VLSAEEALVLDIRPKQWPRMRAAILAFEAYSGFCAECWQEVKPDRPDIPPSMENIEAFAEFCVAYAGLSGEQAYRAWYKWELWHIRMGYSYCPTCTNPISDILRARKAVAEAASRSTGIAWSLTTDQKRLRPSPADCGSAQMYSSAQAGGEA
jgi:hypothetical protein